MVGRRPFHIRTLPAAPKVTAADDDANVYALPPHGADLADDIIYHTAVYAETRLPRKRLAADFDDDPPVFFRHKILFPAKRKFARGANLAGL
jgi:hypothetical protein